LDAQYHYKYDLQFRDGKTRFEPIFDCVKYGSSTTLSLVGKKTFGSGASGLFTEEGKIISKREVLLIDKNVTEFIHSLKEKISSITSNNW